MDKPKVCGRCGNALCPLIPLLEPLNLPWTDDQISARICCNQNRIAAALEMLVSQGEARLDEYYDKKRRVVEVHVQNCCCPTDTGEDDPRCLALRKRVEEWIQKEWTSAVNLRLAATEGEPDGQR